MVVKLSAPLNSALAKTTDFVNGLGRIWPLLWQSTPTWTLLSTGLLVAEVIFGLASLYLIKELVDVLTTSLGADDGSEGLSQVILYVTLTGAASLAHLIAQSLASLAQEIQGLIVADHVNSLIHTKAVEVDLSFYESARYFDTLQRAREAGSMRPAGVASNLLQMGKNTLMLVAIGGLIISIHWLLVPVLVVSVVPGLLVRLYFTRALYDWRRRRTQLERKAGYVDWLMTSDHHAKELRINQLGPFLRQLYISLRTQIRTEQIKLNRWRTLLEAIIAIAGTLAFFLSLVYLAQQTAAGRTSVGDLVLFLLVFQRGQSVVKTLMSNISKMYEDHLYIGQLFEFLDVKPDLKEPELPKPVPKPMKTGLKLDNVTFQYPGAPGIALRNVSLSIAPGEVVALVGANGSGKTSLIKVLCRLYDPTQGQLLLDGIDVRLFSPEEYRRVFSVIFQDYSQYALTARDNIRFGDIHLDEQDPAIKHSAVASGADEFIQQLLYGYDTQLSRAFDEGQELSIGQWQKVALARAFLHQSQVLVLDEPTSALDANAEFELFRNFRERIGHRAALVISHRLSTVRMADHIYVLDKGRIVEHGSHDTLISQDGVYKQLFERQAFHYRH